MHLKKFLFICCLFLSGHTYTQGVGVNANASAPDNSAMLDVSSTTKGLLVPRMFLSERNAISLPATGLLVYQVDGTSGFYYNAGMPQVPSWIKLEQANNNWMLTGNAGTTGANFIGNTDNNPLYFRTNNTERVRMNANGQVLINGTISRSSQDALEVIGVGVPGATAGFGFPINGYSTGVYAGVYGENTGTGQGLLGQNTSTGTGVYGVNNSTGAGVAGLSTGSFGVTGQTTSVKK